VVFYVQVFVELITHVERVVCLESWYHFVEGLMVMDDTAKIFRRQDQFYHLFSTVTFYRHFATRCDNLFVDDQSACNGVIDHP
jgi:hypothetical protein